MTDPATPADLLAELLCHLRPSHPDLVSELAAERWQFTPVGFAPAPACAHLPGALAICPATGPGAALASCLAPLARQLRWSADYPDHPTLKDAFAHAVIARSAAAVIGCNLLAPQTRYPPHAHRAAEVYLPVNDSGARFWQASAHGDRRASPGRPISHRPLEPYAMTTRGRPALNLWIQHGEQPGGPAWFT